MIIHVGDAAFISTIHAILKMKQNLGLPESTAKERGE